MTGCCQTSSFGKSPLVHGQREAYSNILSTVRLPAIPSNVANVDDRWDAVYANRPEDALSWFQAEPTVSLRLIGMAAQPPASVIDAGGGASRLVDRLSAAGYADLTVADVSAVALEQVRKRVPMTASVQLIRADLLDWDPGRTFEIWHDRAVLHFLTRPSALQRYVALVSRSVRAGGALVLGTFGPNGPTSCSGLPTARYDSEGLSGIWSASFDLEHAETEEHHTPWDSVQEFTWAVFRRRPDA